MSLSYLFLLSGKKYLRFFVHRYATGLSTLIFYWLIFRDICICWIPIIHTSMCLFKEMFTLLVWSGGEAWKAECLCGDLWPELLQGFYFLTIKKKQGIWTPTPPIICIFYLNCCDMSRKKALTTSIQSTLLYVIKNILP